MLFLHELRIHILGAVHGLIVSGDCLAIHPDILRVLLDDSELLHHEVFIPRLLRLNLHALVRDGTDQALHLSDLVRILFLIVLQFF